MEQRLDASYTSLSTQILQSRRENNDALLALRSDVAGEFSAVRVRFEKLESAIVGLRGAIREGDEDTRRFMMILHEEVLSKFKLLNQGDPSSS